MHLGRTHINIVSAMYGRPNGISWYQNPASVRYDRLGPHAMSTPVRGLARRSLGCFPRLFAVPRTLLRSRAYQCRPIGNDPLGKVRDPLLLDGRRLREVLAPHHLPIRIDCSLEILKATRHQILRSEMQIFKHLEVGLHPIFTLPERRAPKRRGIG